VLETRRQSAQEVAQAAAQLLRDRFGASRVVLFGSVLTADFHEASDIDLAVWGIAPADYFAAVGWLQGLSEFAIDLVEAPAPDYLKPAIEAGVTL
jgi:predicted nucleotidyltransferase